MNVMVSDLNGEEQGGEYAHGVRWGDASELQGLRAAS